MSISAEEKVCYLREAAIVLAKEGFQLDEVHTDRLCIRIRKAAPPSGSGQNRSETDSTNCSSVADNGSHIREKALMEGLFLM